MAVMSSDPVTIEVSGLVSRLSDVYGAQARFARRLSVSGSAISSWKAMKVRPEPDRWPDIERFFGLSEGHLRRVEAGEIEPGGVQPTSIDGQNFALPGIEPTSPAPHRPGRRADLNEVFSMIVEVQEAQAAMAERLVAVEEELAANRRRARTRRGPAPS